MTFCDRNILEFFCKQHIFCIIGENSLEEDWRWHSYSESFCVLFLHVKKIVCHKELSSCNCALLQLYCRIQCRNWTKLRFKRTLLSLQQTPERENTSPWFPGQNCALINCEQVGLRLASVNI